MLTAKPTFRSSSQCFGSFFKNTHYRNPAVSPLQQHFSLHKRFIAFSVSFRDEKFIWDSSKVHSFNGGMDLTEKGSFYKHQEEEEREDEVEFIGGRKVKCVVEVISWRERRIKAEISVNADVECVWNALTDYERLADFVPNLVSSRTIPCPHPGRIWLEQRGMQRALYWHIEARVVLDLQEHLISKNHHELCFSMVDGDFNKFEGKWSVKSEKRSRITTLTYELNVIPRFNFPAIFIERIIRSDLPKNLHALACRSESNFEGSQTDAHVESFESSTKWSHNGNIDVGDSIPLKNSSNNGSVMEKYVKAAFGPLSPCVGELNSNWGIYGKSCSLEKPCLVDEVHLRRFDGLLEDGGVHRCVVASITVKATVCELWSILTAYERLPEIVPNLAISKILSREKNKVRILQEGCKGLLYMVLHARVILDLCEHFEQEITFEQVEGDFESFHGKWILEKLGSHHTLLKYSVESKVHKNSLLPEAIMEEVIYEDLPSNLCAIRDYVEKREMKDHQTTVVSDVELQKDVSRDEDFDSSSFEDDENSDGASGYYRRQPKVPGLQRSIEVLKSELSKFISEHGQEGFMPMRKQLRNQGRVDIEKAITRMGGFRRIASIMNLSLAYKQRKPKGYWDDLENLQEEINKFQKSWGMDPAFMPSRKTFERAGRYDIARALEKWGGLHEVSRLLALKVRHPNRQSREKKTIVQSNSRINGLENNISHETETLLLKLKDFDMI